MRGLSKQDVRWMLTFVLKDLGYIIAVNLIILLILSVLEILDLFTPVLIYEGFIVVGAGGLLFLISLIYYKEDTYFTLNGKHPHRRLSFWNYKIIFKRLKPEERQRYRQEGISMVMVGFILWLTAIIVHFFIITR